MLVAGLLVGLARLRCGGGGPDDRDCATSPSAPVVTVVLLLYLNLTDWFTDPSIGIVLIALSSVGWAFVVTSLSTGLRNRKALYSALTRRGARRRRCGCRCSTSGSTPRTPASWAGRS